MDTVPFQPDLRPALPCVFGAKDYRDFRDTLVAMDRILAEPGLEDAFVRRNLGGCSETSRPLVAIAQANGDSTPC